MGCSSSSGSRCSSGSGSDSDGGSSGSAAVQAEAAAAHVTVHNGGSPEKSVSSAGGTMLHQRPLLLTLPPLAFAVIGTHTTHHSSLITSAPQITS
jgi:hypothetical protein